MSRASVVANPLRARAACVATRRACLSRCALLSPAERRHDWSALRAKKTSEPLTHIAPSRCLSVARALSEARWARGDDGFGFVLKGEVNEIGYQSATTPLTIKAFDEAYSA